MGRRSAKPGIDVGEVGMRLTAKWIWKKQDNYNAYNMAILARRTFKTEGVSKATMAITADSWYRLIVNGEWVADGPCRSWPDHYQYDVLDVTSYLRGGANTIEVVARHFGVGTFHQVPVQAGLLAQLDMARSDGKRETIVTDEGWETRDFGELVSNTPKTSVQMEPFEQYDARIAPGRFAKAEVLHGAHRGPWQDLHARDCALLTRQPFDLRGIVGARVVRRDWMCFGFPVGRLLYPGLIEANNHVSMASVVATCVIADKKGRLRLDAPGLTVTVNGKRGRNGSFALDKGENFLLVVVTDYFSHWSRDVRIRFIDTAGFQLENPCGEHHEDPWVFAALDECRFISSDIDYGLLEEEEKKRFRKTVEYAFADVFKNVRSRDGFMERFGTSSQVLSSSSVLSEEAHAQFMAREVLGSGDVLVKNPAALMRDSADFAVVHPSKAGDVELAYDFGEQNCGYYDFELIADEGVVVDIFGIEYIARDGTLQHTGPYRNGMRYVCKDGLNRFTSLKRRSQQYLFVTFRNVKRPVRIRKLRLIESTYPVTRAGSFSCSDAALERIWDISARTLKLCMEDTFTDCPLYEQTLWVGDARNEAVFAFTAFGAQDLSARCITLAGQSLDHYPLVLCQLPSAWETLLPAWSFLWGISVWDHYFYTGDREFLALVWPWVMRNLHGAARFLDQRGLFSAPFWNMFDWTDIDDSHATVIHNSMFLVGALDAALKCADVLKDASAKTRLTRFRKRTVDAVNALWDNAKGAYPDSVHEDGTVSASTCQHTSFLAVLYDVVSGNHLKKALRNLADPPEGMVGVGSPFAIMYLYEALEKAGLADRIVSSIHDSYLPMLEEGASTVWESFSTGTTGAGGFPTRSHCHAWSSAPVHFLNRIVLGIVPTAPGGAAFRISPRLNGLTWARGATATINGPVNVEWRRTGSALDVTASGPKGVRLRFVANDTLNGLTVTFNGRAVEKRS
jgi:alpha-L-rhamnosidase